MSDDDSNWYYIHTQTNRACSSFPSFSTGYSNTFRYFKLTGTGLAAGGGSIYNIAFYYIKFNGNYIACPTPVKVIVVFTCVAKKPFLFSPLIMIMISS